MTGMRIGKVLFSKEKSFSGEYLLNYVASMIAKEI